MKRLWNWFTLLLTVLAVAAAVSLGVCRMLGWQFFTVLSGSMEPTLPTGSVILVKPVDPAQLREGQIISFLLDADTVATHRVVEVLPDEEEPGTIRFRTKGDSNQSPDGTPVHSKNVLGTPVLTLPGAGRLLRELREPPGRYLVWSAGVIALILLFLPDLLRAAEKADAREKTGGRTP